MTAPQQLSSADLAILLELFRAGTFAEAGRRLQLDPSTIFRAVQRAEKGLGQRLFERRRGQYVPNNAGVRIVQHAEAIERELEAMCRVAPTSSNQLTGVVRVGAVDAVLNQLVLDALAPLAQLNPQLRFEFCGSNDLTNLARREVDVAVRSTQRPPEHLIGRRLGRQRFAIYAEQRWADRRFGGLEKVTLEHLAHLPWIGIDDAMPEHPGVTWRQRQMPGAQVHVRANSMLTVAAAVEAGMGIGILATFHAQRRPKLVALTQPLEGCETGLWLLTHPESRHQPRIAAVARHLVRELPVYLQSQADEPQRLMEP